MDYVFCSSILNVRTLVTVAYDIACQWYKNLWTRVSLLPPTLQPLLGPEHINFKVGKLHLQGHEWKCQSAFSFNYSPGVGRTDGEGIERLWAFLRGIAASTKEMGPGGRQDTLDDFCAFSNWRKHVGIGTCINIHQLTSNDNAIILGDLLQRRMLEALVELHRHLDEFDAFNSTLRMNNSAEVDCWADMLTAYERDTTAPCPFEIEESGTFNLVIYRPSDDLTCNQALQ